MKIRDKNTGDVIDIERVTFFSKDKDHPNYVVETALLDDPIIKAINETFEDVNSIVLPKRIRKALQAWIDVQNKKITSLIFDNRGVYGSAFFTKNGGVGIEFEEPIDLDDDTYSLEELGLEAKNE